MEGQVLQLLFSSFPDQVQGKERKGLVEEGRNRGLRNCLRLGVAGGGGAARDAEDIEVEDELAIFCNFASLFKQI